MKTLKRKVLSLLLMVLTVMTILLVAADTPIVGNQTATTNEDTSVTITLTATDNAGNPPSFFIDTIPQNGNLDVAVGDISGNQVTYTPAPNFNGTDSFTFGARDEVTLDSAIGTVTITVNNVDNDAPAVNSLPNEITTEEESVTITLTGYDPDSPSLNFSIVSQPANGTLSAVTSTSSTSATVTYTPNDDFPSGHVPATDSFTFRANDGTQNSTAGTVTITVNPENDNPDVTLTSTPQLTAVEGVALNNNQKVAVTASDAENDLLSVDQNSLQIVIGQNALSSPWLNINLQNQELVLSGTPTAEVMGVNQVTLQVTDGQTENSLSDPLNFNITVKPALEILRDSVEIVIDGEVFALDDDLNVTPGLEDIIVRYTVKNNFNKKLGGFATANKIFMDATKEGDDEPFETKVITFLNPGDTAEFETDVNIPSTVGSTYELELKVSHTRKDGTVFDDVIPLEFTVLKENADVLITDAEFIVDGEDNEPLTCSRTASLDLEVTNTGNSQVNPGVLIYTEEQFNFDTETGKFEGEELVKQLFDDTPLEPQQKREVLFGPLDLSGLSLGEQSLFIYLVDVDFETDTPFIGDQEEVSFDVESCLTNPDPDGTVVHVRPNVPQRFSADLDQLTLKSGLKWFIGAAQQRLSQGKTFFQKAFTPGTYNVKVEFTNPSDGYTENVTWTVIATNKPQTTSLALPNFDEIKNPASYPGFAVENSNGKIVFNQAVNLLGILDNKLLLDDLVTIDKIGSNPPTYLIAVDAAAAPGLAGRSATITLPSTFTNPLILKSSGFESGELSECPATSCTGSNQDGKFVLTVPSFSTYVVMEEINAGLVVLPTELSFDNVNAGQTVNATITISNVGTVDALTGLTAQFVGVNASFNPQLTGLTATLNPGDQKQLQLSLTIPTGEPSGRHSIGTLRLTSSAGTVDVPLFVNPKSFLTVKTVKVNGKSDGKFQLDEPTTVKVEVKNDHNQDMENIVVTVTLKNINEEELEEESEEFDLDNGKDEEVELTFDLRNEDVENEQFTMEIAVEGEDQSGTVHRTVETRTVQLDLENHNVIVKAAALETASLSCQRQTRLKVTVQNIGKTDEDDVEIRIRNTALGLNMVKLGIDLDDFASEDNEYQALGTINAEDAPAGLYPITVEVYRDGKLEDTEEVSLEVKGCGQPTGGTGTATGTIQPPTEQKKEVVIDVASQKLAEELQKQLAARKAALEQPQPATITSFRESGMYLPLLGVFVALVFLAVVLGLVVLVTRK